MSDEERNGQILVVGVGNEFRGDDALGIEVARIIRGLGLPNVSVFETGGDAAALIDLWRERENVIVVDAFSSGAAPGMLHCIDATIVQIPSHYFGHSSHALGLAESIELARRLDMLPTRLLVCGIECYEFEDGVGMSRLVREKIPELVEEILLRIHEMESHVGQY
jgi:hydrogenase maturation protease